MYVTKRNVIHIKADLVKAVDNCGFDYKEIWNPGVESEMKVHGEMEISWGGKQNKLKWNTTGNKTKKNYKMGKKGKKGFEGMIH